jgi:hypothetical protein
LATANGCAWRRHGTQLCQPAGIAPFVARQVHDLRQEPFQPPLPDRDIGRLRRHGTIQLGAPLGKIGEIAASRLMRSSAACRSAAAASRSRTSRA